MSLLRRFLTVLAVTILISHVGGNHIRTGNMHTDGEFDTPEGPRRYSTDAVLEKPVICWEDLVEDDISVAKCTNEVIQFVGDIDPEDFTEGVVVTFPTAAYKSSGCPMPKYPKGEKEPEVIFRLIESVRVGKNKAIIHTSFINAGLVVPTIVVEVAEFVSSNRADQGQNNTSADLGVLLPTSSRTNNLGFSNFEKSGSLAPFSPLSISWFIRASGGICRFKFELFRARVIWEQRLDVTAAATVTIADSFRREGSQEIFKTAIPGAGFSFNVILLGRVSVGFTAAINLETELNVGAAASVTFAARLIRAERMTLGLRGISRDTLPGAGAFVNPTSGVAFNTAAAGQASADGFVGLRPILAAEIELPRLPDVGVGIGGTVGLKATIGGRFPPFPAVTSGRTIGVCRDCHFVQGSLDLEGRRLSVTAEAPVFGTKEFVIVDNIFTYRIGTLCLFSTTCSAAAPPPGIPTGVAPSRTPTPSPRPRCPCRCSFGSRARRDCARAPFNRFCRVRRCSFFRRQCC